MPNVQRTILLAAALLLLAAPMPVHGQVAYDLQPDSKLWVDGTSNKSDWTVNAAELAGHVKMQEAASGPAPAVTEVHVTVPAARLAGGKSTIMDRLMYNTLKVDEHPEITYVLSSAEVAPTPAPTEGAFTLNTTGKLTIAGVTKDVVMTVKGEKTPEGHLRFTGSHTMLMTDYEMTPPTALFGALHTADEVTVHFDVVVSPGKGQ